MRISVTICLLVCLCFCPFANAAEDWVLPGRFRLCFREDVKSGTSGHVFLFREDGNELGCLRGTYFRDDKAKRLFVEIFEGWYGTREGSDRIWWSRIPSIMRFQGTPAVQFEFMYDNKGKLILTHDPKSSYWFADRQDYFKGFEVEPGEIFELEKAKTKTGLKDNQLPPGFNEAEDHLNRYVLEPSKIWGLPVFVDCDMMMNVADASHKNVGLASFKLTPEKDNKFQGTVWMVYSDHEEGVVRAGRGNYKLNAVKNDSQSYQMALSFPRTYKFVGGKGPSGWRADLENETGFTVVVRMRDREFVEPLYAYVKEMFFIDGNGKRQTRYQEQSFVAQIVKGSVEERAYWCLGLSVVNSFEIKNLGFLTEFDSKESMVFQQLLIDSSPPGYEQTTIRKVKSFLADARAAVESGRLGDASQYFEQHLKKQPRDNEVMLEYGKLIADSNPVRSLELFQRLVAANPDSAENQMYMGFLLDKAGNPVAADHFEKLLKLTKDKKTKAFACRMIAPIKDRQGEYEEAFKFYSRAWSYDTNDLRSANNATWVYCLHGNTKWGRSVCDRFSEALTPEATGSSYWTYLDTLAAYRAENGEFEEAVRLQREVLEALDAKKFETTNETMMRNCLAFYENKVTLKQSKEFRNWKIKNWEVRHFGKLTGFDGTVVQLLLLDGETKRIPIDMLSDADQEIIRKTRHSVAKPAIK